MSASYVALLRGINVGGKNLIRMADLRGCFEMHGFEGVSTYIQSGNVLFRSDAKDPAGLAPRIADVLAKTFRYSASVTVRSREGLQATVDGAPGGFGSEPDLYRYDVIFLMPPLTSDEALRTVPVREGVDTAHAGPAALYFSRLAERASESRLARLVSMPIYRRVTIRNWNTTTKLLSLMDEVD